MWMMVRVFEWSGLEYTADFHIGAVHVLEVAKFRLPFVAYYPYVMFR